MLLSMDMDPGERQRDVKKRPENDLADPTLPIRESDWGGSLVNAQLAAWTEDVSSNPSTYIESRHGDRQL